MIHYCMTKGWLIKEPSSKNYRNQQQPLEIVHKYTDIFDATNDFVNYKSNLINYEEDDLDSLNFDIQNDLVESG
jgi:hypothetical protein